MGDIESKDEISKEIGIFKTINDLPDSKPVSSFNDVKSAKRNILPYLLTMLANSCEGDQVGSDQNPPTEDEVTDSNFDLSFSAKPPSGVLLEATGGNKVKCNVIRILLEILIEFLPELIRIIKEAVVVAMREALSCGSDFQIPVGMSQIIDLKTIDHKGILNTDPDLNLLGGIFFGSDDKDFNRWLYNTMQTPNTPNTWMGPNGPLMDVTFIQPGQVIFEISSNYDENSGNTFNDFISDYMASIELFNQKIILGNLMNSFFSNVTGNIKPSIEEIMDEEKTEKLMDKILDTDPCEEEVIFDDTFFSFNNDEILEMEKRAQQRKLGRGVDIDLGCGIFTADMSEADGNIFVALDEIDKFSQQNNPTKMGKSITNALNTMQDSLANQSPPNKESIKKKVQIDMMLKLPKVMCNASILTPKILGIYNFSNYIVNNTTITERTSYDWAKSNTVFFEYVLRESLAVLVEIVFRKLKVELMRLIAKVIQKIIKSITKKKLRIIASFALPAVGNTISGLINKIPQPEVAGSQYK